MWQVKAFEALSPIQLYHIFKTRVEVFVVEQACAYPEIDHLDTLAYHLFKEEEGKIKAYCRLIPCNQKIKLGRVLVIQEERGSGLGKLLLEQALHFCRQQFPGQPIEAQAQTRLVPFYQSFGFLAQSSSYIEDGIPHTDMRLEIK